MSSQTDHPSSAAAAKAQAKADRAYQKAMRPWFKKKRFILPLALVALIFLATLFGEGGEQADTGAESSGTQNQETSQQAPPTTSAGIGSPVRDGKFEFTVTGVERPGKTIGGDFASEEAQGTWMIVRVDVENTGSEAGHLFAESQKAFDTQGREFSSQSVIWLDGWDKAFANQINPGNTVKGAPIVFDVPVGTSIERVRLHDSLFSGGVEVALK